MDLTLDFSPSDTRGRKLQGIAAPRLRWASRVLLAVSSADLDGSGLPGRGARAGGRGEVELVSLQEEVASREASIAPKPVSAGPAGASDPRRPLQWALG